MCERGWPYGPRAKRFPLYPVKLLGRLHVKSSGYNFYIYKIKSEAEHALRVASRLCPPEAVSAPHRHDKQPAPCGHARRTPRTANRSFLLELERDEIAQKAERMKGNMKKAAIT